MFGFRGLGLPRPARRSPETVEQRLDRLERNLENFHAAFRHLEQALEDSNVLSAYDAASSAMVRVTNLWNILLREGVTRTPY